MSTSGPSGPLVVVFLGGGGWGVIIFNSLDRNKMFAVLKQSGNYLFQKWCVKRIYPL